jgi:argininosuccinate synthase
VSYGGGVDSTAMILRMVNEKMQIDYVIFADTGVEVPETYETVKHMKKLLNKHNIEFVTVKNFNKITLLQRCIKRKVFPDTYRRWCTRDFKVRPIHKFYKKILKELLVKNKIEINKKFYENKILHHTIHEYMGIDCKETKRLKIAKEPFIKKFYPLVDWKMERSDCIKYIADQGFPFTIKSGCFFCPYNSPTRW